MKNKKLLMLMEIAIFAAIALVLDQLSFKLWPQGGSISLVMVPIACMALRWGLQAGLTTGLIVGVLQMAFGAYILHWLQAAIDYGIAFTVVGFIALVRKPVLAAIEARQMKKLAGYIVLGTVIGGMLRYVAHSVAGAVFFAEYAGDQNVWLYTIVYNGTYMIPAIIFTAIVAVLLFTSAPRLIQR